MDVLGECTYVTTPPKLCHQRVNTIYKSGSGGPNHLNNFGDIRLV